MFIFVHGSEIRFNNTYYFFIQGADISSICTFSKCTLQPLIVIIIRTKRIHQAFLICEKIICEVLATKIHMFLLVPFSICAIQKDVTIFIHL